MPFDDRGFPDLPRGERAASPAVRRMVGRWLYAIAFMILVMTGLGGATRLSGSGLSIMEWAPIMGGLLAIWLAARSGPSAFKIVAVSLIWVGALWSAIAGYIYSPNFRLKRSPENSRLFWSCWMLQCLLGGMASYLLIRAPF